MNKRRKNFTAIALLLVTGIVVYSFLYGKLFPYSPVIIGFAKHELNNTVVYVQHGTHYDDFEGIDSLIPTVETFHELRFLKKPRIFIFKDSGSYYQRSTSKARFCVFYNGDMVISPWALEEAKKGEISLSIYVEHELSHCLLFQHSGILRGYQYSKWLLEGIAVYSTEQMGTSWYPSKDETYGYIQQGNFMPPGCFGTSMEDQIELDVEHRVTFMYSEFACIVDYLIENYGKDKFLSYMMELTRSGGPDKIFKSIYGIELQECIQDFRESIANQ